MQGDSYFEHQAMQAIAVSSTSDSSKILDSSPVCSVFSHHSAKNKFAQKIKQLEQKLRRDRLRMTADSAQRIECSSLIKQCEILNTTRSSKNAISKLIQELKSYKSTEMNKYAQKIIELAQEIDQTKYVPRTKHSSVDSSLNIKPEDVHKARATCERKLHQYRRSYDFSVHNKSKRQEFFSLCMSIKLKLKSRDSAYVISISELYEEANALGVKREHWTEFINHKFSGP